MRAAKGTGKRHKRELRMQQILISAIAHDIRTPLRYFMLTARSLQQDLARGGETGAAFLDRAELMYASAEKMHALVEELLNYSRIWLSGNGKIRFLTTPLYPEVAAKLDLFQPIARSKGIALVNNVAEQVSIATDPDCFSVILHNVLDNAVKFTAEGEVAVRSLTEGREVLLEMTETGRGMNKNYMDWFNKEDAPLDDHFRPPGLGLLLIKELMHKVKGRTTVSKGGNTGTTITLAFPVTM